MNFFDFFPSLSRSSEAYFGQEAPLAQHLIKHVNILKSFINTNEGNLKNKKKYDELCKITDLFGKTVAKDINAESVNFFINIDPSVNAAAYAMYTYNDLVDIVKDSSSKGSKTLSINLDKMADLEDIIITNEGYKYRNPKGKNLLIFLNTGLFKYETENVSGIIAHEIGHCFQQGIFGLYKNIADILLSAKVQSTQDDYGERILQNYPKFLQFLLKNSLLHKIIVNFLCYLWFPNLISTGIFAQFGAFLHKLVYKEYFKDKRLMTKDIIDKIDVGDDVSNVAGYGSIGSSIVNGTIMAINHPDANRKKLIEVMKDNEKKQFTSDDKNNNEKKVKKEMSNWFFNFFKSISLDVRLLNDEIIHVMKLSTYTANSYEKISFIKKYEFFADIFASSYGFGPELYTLIESSTINEIKKIHEFGNIGINKLPLFNACYKINLYKKIRRTLIHDVHGMNYQRLQNMYTALTQELKTNPNLTPSQKKEILKSLETFKQSDENFYNDMKESGFWYKYYNKLIDNRLSKKGNHSEQTVKEILEPIEEVCKEIVSKKK